MKRSEAIKFLNKLKQEFNGNNDAQDAIDKLLALSESLSENSGNSKKSLDENNLEIPVELKNVDEGFALFSDGACRGNPGPGAYALIVQNKLGEIILKSSGVEMPTTNNKMELQGVIAGLLGLYDKFLEDGHSQGHVPLFVYSDSKYVVDGITSWVPGWKNRGWKKADNKDPENLIQWQELDRLKNCFENIKFIWVKGHAGHPQNEFCDRMCNQALDEAGF
jgi:ribonuclease HI